MTSKKRNPLHQLWRCSSSFQLPDAVDAEAVELWVCTQDGYVESKGLSGKHTIKGIAVLAWKATGAEGMRG